MSNIVDQVKLALTKAASNRSFDDVLLLKSYLSKTEFIATNLTGQVNPRQMNEFCRGILLESHRCGDIIFNQGDIGTKLYIILNGSCELKVKYTIQISTDDIEIREKTAAKYFSGQFFGERALQYNEKRSGTAISLTDCDLIVITKTIYLALIEDSKIEMLASDLLKDSRNQLGSKENVMKTLSLQRDKRANHELEAAAIYLHRNVEFFLKFKIPQIVELCRVAETVTIQGHNILFRQGQVGQAFYVVLGGEVEVWVDDGQAGSPTRAPTRNEAAILANMSKNYLNLVSDLGKKVSTLYPGDIFGERALDAATSNAERAASIVTCNDMTDLLIIHKEDYLSLVYTIMNSDSMDRLSLLRHTEIFRSVDVVHLKALARYMEPRRYKIDDIVYAAGDPAEEMIITEVGECTVLTEVIEDSEKKLRADKNLKAALLKRSEILSSQEMFRKNSTSEKKVVRMGRIAPHSVLASYIILSETAYHEIYHTETIVATSIVECYVISKHDFFIHVPKETRQALKKLVNNFNSLPAYPLWENVPRIRNREEWVQDKCWETFRVALVNSEKKDLNILDHFKRLNTMNFSSTDAEIREKNAQSNAAALSEQSKNAVLNPVKVTLKDWGLRHSMRDSSDEATASPLSRQQKWTSQHGYLLDENLQQSMTRMIHSRLSQGRQSQEDGILQTMIDLDSPSKEFLNMQAVSVFSQDEINASSESRAKPALQLGNPVTPQSPPFTLIQLHKESGGSIREAELQDSKKRTVTCHLRVCCSFNSSIEVKAYADKFMENIYLTVYKSDHKLESELFLRWKFFKGFENMVFTASDHFLIYCRGTPIECASVYASKNIYSSPFPAVCKLPHQMYACIVMNQVKPKVKLDTADSSDNESEDDHSNHTSRPVGILKPSMKSFLKNKLDDAKSTISLTFDSSRNTQRYDLQKDPQFLKDLSSMQEMVAVFPTRLQGLQYAVERFGFVSGPFKEVISANTEAPTEIDNFAKVSSLLQARTAVQTSPGKSPGTPGNFSFHSQHFKGLSSNHHPLVAQPPSLPTNEGKVQLRKLSKSSKRDRVLEVLHSGNKICCVVPLYDWITISEDNIQQLNFLRAFDEPDLSLSELLNRSTKQNYSSRPSTRPGTTESDAGEEEEDKLASKLELVKTFSEVGLLKKPSTAHHDDREDYVARWNTVNNYQQSEAKKDPPKKRKSVQRENDEKLVASKSIENLRFKMESRELSSSLIPTVQKKGATSNRPRSQSGNSISNPPFKSDASLASNSETMEFSIAAEDYSTFGEEPYKPKKAIKIDEGSMNNRLLQMNKSAEQRTLILQMHDKLCEVEHKSYSAAKYRSKLSSIPSGNAGGITPPILLTKSKMDDPRMGFINETLNIVESLQSMQANSKATSHIKQSGDSYPQRGVNKSILPRSSLTAAATSPTAPTAYDNKIETLAGKLQKLSSTFVYKE